MPPPWPPHNAGGEVAPHDDPAILGTDRIIRRISPHYIVADDKAASRTRISSMAFQASTRGNRSMSVDLERSIRAAGLDPAAFVTQPPFIGSVVFSAGGLRSQFLMVGTDPLDGNPHHGGVWGNFTKACQRQLRALAEWYVRIDTVAL